ncbi:unnamed protein product [Nippostrongylus brasiliensis]|uniref:Secreted protein n=1 Tax=Nippostrongylus brasiliensis TaxID=27835 RepID=A0A0N4YIC9_NIPBR|nr:unnamed protein product [Nippostrongylus brasiliensis]
MWLVLLTAGVFAPEVLGLSCKPRTGGTPVPLGVFLTTRLPDSLDQKPFDARPAIKLALNYIQNHSCLKFKVPTCECEAETEQDSLERRAECEGHDYRNADEKNERFAEHMNRMPGIL